MCLEDIKVKVKVIEVLEPIINKNLYFKYTKQHSYKQSINAELFKTSFKNIEHIIRTGNFDNQLSITYWHVR